MRPLNPEFQPDYGRLSSKLTALSHDIKPPEIDSVAIRERLKSRGFRIEKTLADKPHESRPLLCVDSSYGKLDLKFYSLFGLHCVSLYAVFSCLPKEDALVGQGTVPYRDMLYDSYIDVGLIKPYSDTESRLNLIRVAAELGFMIESNREIEDNGVETDFLVLDGSLSAIKKDLEAVRHYPEYEKASSALRRLSDVKVVSMVEDSHATDISSEAGVELTNLHLLDMVLKPLEYVVKDSDGIHVIYVKLPGKRLCFKPNEDSKPLTVRWEFNYANFESDLNYLVGSWACEDDLLHPQVYPMRITDYLTRKIRVSGVLEEFAKNRGLEWKHRDLREY